MLTCPALLNFIKIFSLFNTQPKRNRASHAIFKHVLQVPYSSGFKFGEKGPVKILSHFCLQVRRCWISTHNLIGLGPPPQFLSMWAGPLLKGLQISGKGADHNFGPFLLTGPALLNFIKILSLFNTQHKRNRASHAIFKHVLQVPYSSGFKFGEKGPVKILSHFCLQVRRCWISTHNLIGLGPPPQFLSMWAGPLLKGLQICGKGADQNFGPFLLTGPALLNFIKILSLFNTQPNRPRASPAIFKHVCRSPTQGASNFRKRGRSKFWPIFAYRPGAVEFHQNFKSFQHTT